jgi:polyisoprenoid-binding protein YceI
MMAKVRGRFPAVSGTITIADEPEQSHVEIDIDVASVDTGHADRDNHLRGGDFFDAENHPTTAFPSTKVEAAPRGSWIVTGDLTVRGVTDPVTLHVDFEGAGASPAGDNRIGFSVSGEVNREDFDLEHGPRNRRRPRAKEDHHRAQRRSRRRLTPTSTRSWD